MRTLGSTLTTAQKAGGDAICRLVLTLQSDSTAYTYDITSATNRILNLQHTEQEWSQTAQITVDNRDGNLTALTLEGCSAVISYGYVATYSACAPLEAIASKTDSMQGELVTTISLAGVFNMMGEDEASEAYTPEDTNGDTVKTILTAIANKTMACFSHCKSYTITFDSEDSLIDVFKPADYFSVGFKESRLSAFKKALSYTKCKARIEDDGEIHVFSPTISGDAWVASTAYVLNDYVQPTTATNLFAYRCTTAGTSHTSEPTWPTTAGSTVTETGGLVWTAVAFDYEYNDAYGDYHNFFDKSVRKRLVIPNKVTVSSHPDHSDSYTGNAADAASYAALGDRYIIEYHYARPTSNAQCTSIATAMMQNYQLAAETGHGIAPMNCGQEVMDYVKITDSRASDVRVGNIGYLNRWYSAYRKEPTRFGFEFRFGSLFLPGLAGTMPPRAIEGTIGTAAEVNLAALRAAYFSLADTMQIVINNQQILASNLELLWNREVVAKWHITDQAIIPVWIPE